MVLGLRVVRGPDWNHGNQDGGQDHVGTVAEKQGESEVKVQWDMGSSTLCKAGGGKHELRILDSATIGVNHPNIGCICCEEVCIIGTRWVCSSCDNTNLCTLCYHDDKHDTKHEFLRVDLPGSKPVRVPKRISSQKSRALGLFPNASVTRGANCQERGQKDEDGTVEDVLNFGHDQSDRNAVRVRWRKGTSGVYRVGYQGNVDLMCLEEAPGGSFYPSHMAELDVADYSAWKKSADLLSIGDKVCVEITQENLKQLQQGRRKWSARLEEIIGEVGVIRGFTSEGDVEVDYEGDVITLVQAAVCKVPGHDKGDKVKVLTNRDKIKRLQKKHGGWDDNMDEVMGKVGTVSVVDKDGDVGVVFDDGNGFVFNPACLIPVQKGDTDPDDEESDIESAGDENALTDTNDEIIDDEKEDEDTEGVNLIQALAGLLLLDALSNQTNAQEGQTFLKAVSDGDVTVVKQMIARNPALKQLKHKGIPAFSIAAFQGHVPVLETLLDSGCDIEDVDEVGNTALIVSIEAEKEETALYLLERGANIRVMNKHGRTPCHCAAIKNLVPVLRVLLDKGCNPNAQDVVGDTPLHDAISMHHDEAATVLIQHPDINVWLLNGKQFNVMHLACMKAHSCVVDKLLSKDLKLASTAKVDGFMPLHIAAINNHTNEASILLVKGRADPNVGSLSKQSPIHLAADEAYFDMVQLLLTYGADLNIKDVNGNTPLHMCMMGRRTNQLFLQMLGLRNLAEDNERIKIANFMIQHGAKIDIVNNAGETAISGCKIQHMCDAVSTFAKNNKPTKPDRPNARPNTSKVAQEMFTSAKQKCHKCSEVFANVRFMPCKHMVSCDKCCFKYKKCPICDKDVNKRVDRDNHTIESKCVIS